MGTRLNRSCVIGVVLGGLTLPTTIGCSSSSRTSASSSTGRGVTSAKPVASGPLSPPNSNSSPSPTRPSACALLTTSDIRIRFGGTVTAGSPTDAPDGSESICDWIVTKTDGSGMGVQLDVHSHRSLSDWDQQRRINPAPSQTLRATGDDAFSQTVKAGPQVFDDLWVRKASINFRLEVLSDMGAGPLESLARIVLNRL